MKRWIAPLMGLIIAGAVAVPVFAQSQSADSTGQGAVDVRGRGLGVMICSTSNTTDTVAEALGISASELRVALVSGQSVSQIAASKNVDVQTIQDALATQRKADLDQALADGLVTQAQYDAITQAMANAPALNNSNFEIRVPAYNTVGRAQVVADALGISCADLVKAEQGGSAIAQIAADKGVEVQAVIDALTTAYKDALAKDVEEGLITQAQSDGRLSNLSIEIGQWVYNERGNGFGGPGMGNGQGGPGMGGFGQRDGQNGNGMGNGQGGFGQHGGQGGPGMGNGQMPNAPLGFGQQNAPTQPEATVTPNT